MVGLDDWISPPPEDYARALILYLQQPEYQLLHGQYVSSKALEEEFYPRFLLDRGWDPMPWRTVGVALGRLTRKRDKEFRCVHGGKWQRRSITQFLIPRPKDR